MPEKDKTARDPGWLLLIHQIPPKPNYFRVKIWRRLQRLGAVGIKNSVYALPSSEQAQEDLNWVLREIVEGGGDASLVEARLIEGLNDEQVREMFRAARDADYQGVADEVRQVARWLRARAIAHHILIWDRAGPRLAAGLQAAARSARYGLLANWCRTHGVLHLALAHHAMTPVASVVEKFSARGIQSLF